MFSIDLAHILEKYLGSAARTVVENKMTAAIPRVTQGMTAKSVTLDQVPASLVVHDALFRLWRSCIPSGDVSDLVRDHMEAKVAALVLPQVASTPKASLNQVVLWTKDAALQIAF